MLRLFLFLILLVPASCAVQRPARQGESSLKASRRQLQKSSAVLKSPTNYLKRTIGHDEKTGEDVTYDPKPHVEKVDDKSGKYAFKWVGYDGKEKVVEYQRDDAIDAVVSASVSKTPEGRYLYTYRVSNLPSSPTYLSSFIVQNFAADTRPVEVNGQPTNDGDLRLLSAFRNSPNRGQQRNLDDMHFGEMTNLIEVFKEGTWIDISVLEDASFKVNPGQEIEMKLLSSAPPGLVGCRATAGSSTLKGAGEHMPTELENVMPGYDAWPSGYTLGPDNRLASLPPAKRAEYVLARLPLFEQLGWVTPSARAWYEQRVKQGDLAGAASRAGQDLKSEQITTEVYALLQAAAETR
jgi:hypothetical protein